MEQVIGGTGDWEDSNLKLLCSRSETWINLSPLKLLWDLDPSVHNVLFGQYVFLPTEQADTYLKIYVLIYH